MRHLPWITLAVAAAALASAWGRELIYLSFLSGEQLSNAIARPLLLGVLATLLLLAVLEWWIKQRLRKRRLER